jgi:hypothetical protein
MGLSPSQILRVTGASSGGGNAALSYLRSQSASDPLANALEQAPEGNPDHSDSVLNTLKKGIGHVVSGAGRTLDAGRAAVVSGALELGEALRPLRGAESTASLSDFRENFNRRLGVGDVLEQSSVTANLPLNVKRGIGLVGDLATDPLNYVTLGQSTTAKAAASRLASTAGEDVARVAAREGIDQADELLARRFAQEQADAAATLATREKAYAEALAKRAEQPQQLDLFDEAVGGIPDVSPVLRPAILDQTAAPTVRGLLGAETSAAGTRAVRALERTGAGGVGLNLGRLGAPTLLSAEDLAPVAGLLKPASAAVRESEFGRGVRKALVPLTDTRDKFGSVVADLLPGIGHRREQLVAAWKSDLDNQLKPLIGKNYDKPAADAIRAALDVGGSVDEAALLLDGNTDALNLLDTLVQARDKAYDTLVQSGVSPQNLMPKDEYLRHVLTDEGAAAFGIDKTTHAGTRSGKFKSRVREGSIDTKMAEDGIASYVDDPVRLVRSSFHYAQDVGGNAMAVDALEDAVKNAKNLPPGVEVSDIVRHSAKDGFHEVAPGRWVADTIYSDLFNLGKAGTQSSIVRAWDTFSSVVKRQTLFNPVSFGPYFTQNMATGIGMNAVDGVRFSDYAKLADLHRASARALKEGGERGFDDALRRIVPDAADRELIHGLRNEGIFGAGHSLYDDVAEGTLDLEGRSNLRKAAELGTQHTAKVNQWGEEMLRGAAYMRHRLNGMTSDVAADLVRKRHLDYSALGRTAFERNVINRFIFFPSWLMRAPKAIIHAYAHAPGAFNAQARLEMGTQWYDRKRNQYGELIGPRMSGPLSFLTGLGNEIPDQGGDLLNPAARFILDSDARKPTDILPPLAAVGRATAVAGDLNPDTPNEKRSRYERSLLGVRTGVDYDEQRSMDDLEQRILERTQKGLGPTPSQVLAVTAVEAGIPGAAGMNTGDLVYAMVQAGFTTDKIREILSAPRQSAPVTAAPAGPPVNIDELLAAGKSRGDIAAALQPATIMGISGPGGDTTPPVWEDGSVGFPVMPTAGNAERIRQMNKLLTGRITRSPLSGKVGSNV